MKRKLLVRLVWMFFMILLSLQASPQTQHYRMCVTPIWEPFSFLNEKGGFEGILADYKRLISQKSGISFDLVYTQDYKESRRYLYEGRCDVILSAVKSQENSQKFLITKPFATFPRAYATHIDTPWSVNFSYLLDDAQKRVGIVYGAPAKEYLQRHYPGIEIATFKNTKEGLKALSSKSIIAFVNILPTLAYTIQINGFNDIKIGGYIPGDIPLSMFVNRKHPELFQKLQHTISSISEQERLDILDQWVHIEQGITYSMAVWIFLSVLMIVAVILLLLYLSQRHNRKLKNLLNASIEGVFLFEKGKVVDANRSALHLCGYHSLEEMLHRRIETIYSGHIPKGDAVVETLLSRRDGSRFVAHVKFSSLDDYQSSHILSVIDLTRLKKAERALQELNDTLAKRVEEEVEKNLQQQFLLVQQNRLAQMGEMISMIAHQWRQPLNNLSLIFQTFLLKYQRGKLDRQMVETLSEESKKQLAYMSGTIDDFRDFFKPSRDKTYIALDALISEAVALVSPLFEESGIALEIDVAENIELFLHANELKQVLINILNNAKEAFGERVIETKRVRIRGAEHGSEVQIEISDNAGGVPEAIIKKIFDPYFSTKLQKHGTGLGLYMSKKIVEDYLGGSLTITNSEEGASFVIVLPLGDTTVRQRGSGLAK